MLARGSRGPLAQSLVAAGSRGALQVLTASREAHNMHRVFKNTYRDSVELMRIAAELKKAPGVNGANLMMATTANLRVMNLADIGTTPNDLVVTVDAADEGSATSVLEQAHKLLTAAVKTTGGGSGANLPPITTLAAANAAGNGANLALISVPGSYAAGEAMKAVKQGMHVFMFSDNVSVEAEAELKRLASASNLLVMGPDCGTAMLDGVPLGFVNSFSSQSNQAVGFVGASGTGLQEISTLVDRLSTRVTQIIGVGGRDLHEDVGGAMMLSGIRFLENDPATSVIVLVSKPPSDVAAKAIYEAVRNCKKPVVINFLGADAADVSAQAGAGAVVADNLDEAALAAVMLARPGAKYGQLVSSIRGEVPAAPAKPKFAASQTRVRGLYSGGTLCKESQLILKHEMGADKYKKGGHTVIDLGDDEYTVGRPHPMIDPTLRNEMIAATGSDASAAVVLFDLVLGHGAAQDPSTGLIASIRKAKAAASAAGRNLVFVASVTGTGADSQGIARQRELLTREGVILAGTNADAALLSASYLGASSGEDRHGEIEKRVKACARKAPAAGAAAKFFPNGVVALNEGLESFVAPLKALGTDVTHVGWRPPAAGDEKLSMVLARLYDSAKDPLGQKIVKANALGIERLKAARPILRGIMSARQAMPEMGKGKMIMHAGPPITFERMCGPMKGAVTGAILFEKWAKTPEEAVKLAASGEVRYSPCHHQNAVGPMAGIVSPSMPVFVVENEAHGNKAFATMNEGLGKVLRFGAYDQSVLTRLGLMKDVVAPALNKVIEAYTKEVGAINLKSVVAQALQMGDESHNRNVAATSLLTRMLAPTAVSVLDKETALGLLRFMGGNDHFFLNLSMAASKAMLEAAHNIPHCTIATVMARNGVDFGLRVSGLGDRWFTEPAPNVKGLFFQGYGPEQGNPDMGDSSITETFGVGGFAMASSPAIVRFVGGNSDLAIYNTRAMYGITLAQNNDLAIPALDFAGAPLGIDIRKVVETQVAPVINTGIAHKEAGVGQIGAGITTAPLKCFAEALAAFAQKEGAY